MELRPELLPPAVTPSRVEELIAQIEAISELLDAGKPARAAIAEFNEATGRDYEAWVFEDHCCGRDIEEFAKQAARPANPRVPDITRDELIEIVRRITSADYPEDEGDYYVTLLEANVAHPAPTDVIFWPPPELEDASPEQIVDELLRYQPTEP